MSKAALIKELKTFSSDQLIGVIIQAYQSRKDFKEYFEYFLDPQPDKIYDKYAALVVKELNRQSRGRSKARITVLRKILDDLRSFEPGDVYVLALYFYIIGELADMARYRYMLGEAQLNAIGRLIKDTLEYADAAQCADIWEKNLNILYRGIHPGGLVDNIIKQSIEEYNSKRKLKK